MSSFWMPKKQPLYAPMLGTFGGGSVRGFSPGGGSAFDWSQFSSGDLYDGGYVQVVSSSRVYWWFYPAQRGDGQTPAAGNKTGTITLPSETTLKLHVFGGGGGGGGGNGSGGGGGGYAGNSSFITLSGGQVLTYQAGTAGLGGHRDANGSNVNWLGDTTSPNRATSGGDSYIYLGTNSSSTTFRLNANGGTFGGTTSNPSNYNDCGQGGSASVSVNSIGASTNTGSGGDGGSRNLVGENGYGGGGGGGNDFQGTGKDRGGTSTYAGGGGGGSGNGNNPSDAPGGSGGTYGYDGGQGGNTNTNTFGYRGDDLYSDVSSSFPRGAGYSYQSSDNSGWGNTILGRGSAAGGGFPAGGGGSSYYGGGFYGDWGVGGDGASGAVMLEISF